jgi:hypothetical protein
MLGVVDDAGMRRALPPVRTVVSDRSTQAEAITIDQCFGSVLSTSVDHVLFEEARLFLSLRLHDEDMRAFTGDNDLPLMRARITSILADEKEREREDDAPSLRDTLGNVLVDSLGAPAFSDSHFSASVTDGSTLPRDLHACSDDEKHLFLMWRQGQEGFKSLSGKQLDDRVRAQMSTEAGKGYGPPRLRHPFGWTRTQHNDLLRKMGGKVTLSALKVLAPQLIAGGIKQFQPSWVKTALSHKSKQVSLSLSLSLICLALSRAPHTVMVVQVCRV